MLYEVITDELHQERVAVARGRNPGNAWVGQRLDDPAPDLAGFARAQGLEAWGPVSELGELERVLGDAVACLRRGMPCLVDVLIEPRQGREDASPRG